jgi:hypothetical protein
MEVLRFIGQGQTDKQIARNRGIEPSHGRDARGPFARGIAVPHPCRSTRRSDEATTFGIALPRETAYFVRRSSGESHSGHLPKTATGLAPSI